MIIERMNATGIGFAGIDGAWWRPASRPFDLPVALATELPQIAAAVFALLGAAGALYGTPDGAAAGLDALLAERVPPEIPRLHSPAPPLAVRPDFQLVPRPGGYALVATELEICPSAHGFAHAMQVGYGLAPDLAPAYAAMLGGRELIILLSSQWSEFLFDQLAFCRALAERGARARVLCDAAPATLAAEARRGERWRPPMFGVPELPPGWDADILRRAARHGLAPHLAPSADWPAGVGDAVIFRFGYFNCFAPERVALMRRWEAGGATFLNPTSFIYDSKAVMAALQLPAVRAWLAAESPAHLATLDRCIPETHLLRGAMLERLADERAGWVIKYAGYDGGQDAWGGRSLHVGALHTPDTWAAALRAHLRNPWPSVAQRAAPSARLDIAYLDGAGGEGRVVGGNSRLRAFMLKAPGGPAALGAHLTVSGGAGVSEATDAVQAPVRFV